MSILPVYVGLDYHDESIRVCVLSLEGDALVNRDVPNSPGLVEELVLCHGVPRGVAIEACCGAADFGAWFAIVNRSRLKGKRQNCASVPCCEKSGSFCPEVGLGRRPGWNGLNR